MANRPRFRANPNLRELIPTNMHSYASGTQANASISLEEMVRRATEGVTIVPPAVASRSSTPHQTNGSLRSVGIAITGVVCLLLAGIIYAAISHASQASTSNPDIAFYATPFVPLNDDIVKYLLRIPTYDDTGGYGQLTIRSIDWVPSSLDNEAEFVCIRYNPSGTRTTDLAQEYTFVWNGTGWRIVATGDRTVNPCR